MSQPNRTAQFVKLHKLLKKHYKPFSPDPKRPVLEHLLFACVLDGARYEPAEEAFAALVHSFFDWNEVRVTSLNELAEVMSALPDPRAAAHRVKRVLHAVFEESYSFDLEEKRKQTLGPTVKWLAKFEGTSSFVVNYVVQSALGGHAIPIDRGTFELLRLVELIGDEDLAAGVVPGLDRAISKAKGVEFGSLLHQLGADFTANPFSPAVREMLLEINPEIKDRLPKRRVPKPVEPPADKSSAPAAADAPAEGKPSRKRRKAASPEKPADAQAAGAEAGPPPAPAKKSKKPRRADSRPVEEPPKPAPAAGAQRAAKKGAAEKISKRKPR